ncbi:MAG TPA: hypothetical protein VGJ36_00900 [Gemmatimonadales bacterium]|jgi:hypothetical protein
MYRLSWGSVCCLTGLALAACSEQPQQQNPSTPAFAANSTNNCAPTVFNSLIAGYFSDAQQQLKVQGYKNAMLDARAAGDLTTARTYGFHIMREIAVAAKAVSQPPASVGSELTVEDFKCIFDVTDTHVFASPPSANYFEHALDRAAGGGYDIRGKLAGPPPANDPGDPPGPVQAVLNGSVVAAVAPFGTATWDDILPDDATLNPPNARVLIYGEPVDGSPTGAYDWASIPRDAFFATPGALVTTCQEDNTSTEMVTETFGASTGALAWGDATSLCPSSIGTLNQSRGVFAMFGRLARLGRDWLLPQPLAAAALVGTGTISGGNAGSIKSVFDVTSESSVTLAFKDQPQNTFTNQEIPPPVTVTAVGSDGKPVAGAKAMLLLVNNNGKHVMPSNNIASTKIELVNGQPVAIARFTGMSTNKAGGYALEIQPACAASTTPSASTPCSQVSGRPDIGVNIPVPSSSKFNVRQLK